MTEPMFVACKNLDCYFNEAGECDRSPDLGIEHDEAGGCTTFREKEASTRTVGTGKKGVEPYEGLKYAKRIGLTIGKKGGEVDGR